jgi:exosortase
MFRAANPIIKDPAAATNRDWLIAAAMLVAAALASFDAWRDIFRLGYFDEELSYVMLAPLVIFCLAWSRRRNLHNCPITGTWLGVVLVALGAAVFWYGYHYDPVIWRAGAVLIAAATVIASLGTRIARQLAPALLAFIFLIPIDPDGRYHIAGPLEIFTSRATQTVCDILGIYVQRNGNLLIINRTAVTVAEACNGARMVLSLFMVCYFIAFSPPLRAWWIRLALLALSPIVAIVANIVRLVPTIWMFGHASPEAAERFHVIGGYAMLVVAFVVLMATVRFLHNLTTSDNAPPRFVPANIDPVASPVT